VKEDGSNEPTTYINSFFVYHGGEKLGCIGTDLRYRGSEKDLVYTVTSFRIEKSRGAMDTVSSKDMKVALRLAKKVLIPRADDEAIGVIKNFIRQGLSDVHARTCNMVRWTMDFNTEATVYAAKAYQARKNGQTHVELPTRLTSVKDMVEHDKACAHAEDAGFFMAMFANNQGYGVQRLDDDSFNVYHYITNTLKKYRSYDDLPEAVQSKYAMFKVLKEYEMITTIGVNLTNGFYYVVE
jgi:hypothetical protein